MDAVRFQVLGPLNAVLDGESRSLGGPRQRMVLAVLLAHANQVVSQDALIEAVWAGDPPEAARTTLHSYVSHLRRELGDGLVRQGDGYRVAVDEVSLDALRFEHLVEEGRRLLEEDPDAARRALDEGLRLWYGSPYGDLGGEPSLTLEAARLEELRLAAVEHRIEADLASGNHSGVVGELQTLVRDHPYREKLHGMLMLALYRSGRQAEALRAYQRTRTLLGEELGIEPSSELRELEQRILEQDPGLDLETEGSADRVSSPHVARSPRGAVTESARTVGGYELRQPVGEGDYGVVYSAFQPAVGRQVAVKMIRPEYVNRPDFVRRFEKEAQLVARLEHPHIAGLYDYWRDPEGAYLVMPLLRGGNLKEVLNKGPWNLAPALRLLDQVGSALGYAHRQGVVHRDIKPGNVLLDEEGNAYLSDFGVATRIFDEAGTPVSTSLGYIPPEELLGEPLTARSDIFSLGVLAFHLLTGVAPTGHHPLPSLADARPDLPMELSKAVRHATDPDPAIRYGRAEDFLRAVRRAVGSDVVAISEPAEDVPDATPVRNPYKGLRAFMETDAFDFYGRDVLIDEMLRAVGSHPVVAVVGPSGSGKSSLVRAGLVPALRAGGLPGARAWLITDMFPGSFPFEELEAALLRVATERPPTLIDDLTADDRGLVRISKQILPGDDSRLVLIIDQFEEMFSMVRDEATRRLFLDSLVAVGSDQRSRVKVLLTLRADFFDRPLDYPEFGEILKEGLVPIGPPSEEGLAQAIAAPARGVGVELEPGLVGRIISDVEGQPGGLPLLQYALTEVFNRRESDRITIDAYEATGGVRGALGQRAEEIYQQLPAAGREAARQLFLRLVAVDEAADDSRRRVRQTELKTLAVDQGALDQVLHQYGAFRLLSFDRDPVTRGPTVEVAHEALLREWERLSAWIDGQREDLLLHRRLNTAAQEWVGSQRDPSFLLLGGRLEQAERWAERSGIALAGEEEEFLAASGEQRLTEEAIARRRRRLTVGALSAGLVVLGISGAVAFSQRGIAQAEARQETVRQLADFSALAVDEDEERAILLALEAAEVSLRAGEAVRTQTIAALQQAVQGSRLEMRLDRDVGLSFDPHGALVTLELTPPGSGVAHAGFSPDGGLYAEHLWWLEVGLSDQILVWDPATREEVSRLLPTTGVSPDEQVWILNMQWSPDGELIAAGTFNRVTRSMSHTVWEVATGEEVFVFPGQADDRPAFLDAQTLAIPNAEEQAIGLYDLATGEERERIEVSGFAPTHLALDPVRGWLVMGSTESSPNIRILGINSGRVEWSHNAPGFFDPTLHSDTGMAAFAGRGNGILLMDLANGSEVETLRGHTTEAWYASFSPDGQRLVSRARGEVLVWDITPAGPPEIGTLHIGSVQPFKVTVAPDGTKAAVHAPGSVQRFDLATLEAVADPLTSELIHLWAPAAISPDWRLVAAVDEDGLGRVRELLTGRVVLELPPCANPIGFSSDGSVLVLDGFSLCSVEDAPLGAELRSRVIAVPSGEELLDLGEEPTACCLRRAAFNPPGAFPADRYLAVSHFDRVEVYDTAASRLVTTLPTRQEWEQQPASLGFDATGRYLAVGGEENRGWVLDMELLVEGVPAVDALVFNRVVDPGGLRHLAINQNGVLATSGMGTLRLWDLHTGEHLVQIPTDTNLPSFAVFTPEGDHLLYLDETPRGHVLRRFPLDPDELIALARSRVTRDFTPDECDRYGLDC